MKSNQFSRLDKDTITEIAARLDPKSVLKLCDVDTKFRTICQKPQTFQLLLTKHFPNAPFTSNPKKQYRALADGITTLYYTTLQITTEEGESYSWDLYQQHVSFALNFELKLVLFDQQNDDYTNDENDFPVDGIIPIVTELPGLRVDHADKVYFGLMFVFGYVDTTAKPVGFYDTGKLFYNSNEAEQYLYNLYKSEVDKNVEDIIEGMEVGITREDIIRDDLGLDEKTWDDYDLFIQELHKNSTVKIFVDLYYPNQEFKTYMFVIFECSI